jgi:hypothetical protein
MARKPLWRAPQGWSRRFDEPIPLPRGRQLVTLKDAADYIMLPKAEQLLAELAGRGPHPDRRRGWRKRKRRK